MTTNWVPKCRYCGKVDNAGAGFKEGELPPIEEPKPSSWFGLRCDESPTGRHKLEWVRYK